MNSYKKLSVILLIMLLPVVALFGCFGGGSDKNDDFTASVILTSEDNVLTVLPGDSLQLIVSVTQKEGENLIVEEETLFEITEGNLVATITNSGLLTVNETAIVGTQIKVKTNHLNTYSNELELAVGNVEVEDIELTSSTYTVQNDGFVSLTTTITPQNYTQKHITWVFVEGQEIAEIIGNRLFVENATSGDVIKVKAKINDFESNVIEITVGKSLVNLSLSVEDDALVISPKKSVQLMVFAKELNEDPKPVIEGVVFEINEDAPATLTENGLLTINTNAIVGAKITVSALYEGMYSNEVEITVGDIEVENVVLSANSSMVQSGNYTILTTTITPQNYTQEHITWIFVEGQEIAEIVGDRLFVKDAAAGDVIKLKAKVNNTESNVIEITVGKSAEEQYFTYFTRDLIELDFNSTTQNPILEVKVKNGLGKDVNDLTLEFEILSGSEYLSITADGYIATLEILGHGEATVGVKIAGEDEQTTAIVKTILPPSAFELHEVFESNINYHYNFSKIDGLPFPISVIGNKVSQDFKVEFKKDNVIGDFATYNNEAQEITFNQTGKITVIVTSNSGSRLETKEEFTFNINEGVNVYSYEELKSTLEHKNYESDTIINIVVLEKPQGYTNGYNLVPLEALKAKEDQTKEGIFTSNIYAHKGAYINGNKHLIDVSNYKIIPHGDMASTPKGSLFAFGPAWTTNSPVWGELGRKLTDSFIVKLYDLELRGNVGVGVDLIERVPDGVYKRAIDLGDLAHNALAYVDINGLTISGFNSGLRIAHALNGHIENLHIYNNYSNGIESGANIMTLKNITLGMVGGAALELLNEDKTTVDGVKASGKTAGANFNEAQRVSLAGYIINDNNYNDGDTYFLSKPVMPGVSYTDLINLNFALAENIGAVGVNNIRNEDGEFVLLSFNIDNINLATFDIYENVSILEYVNADINGVIKLGEMGAFDNTHQYVEMDMYFPKEVSGLPIDIKLGSVLLYNQNYGKPIPA